VATRLARYLVREVAGLYLLGVAALCLLLSIDLLSVLARFLVEHDASAATVARLVAFKLPWFLHLTLPLAVVFAVLVASGRLAKDAELKAAYAGGVPPFRLLLPLTAVGVAVALVAVLVNGWLEPWGEAAYQAEIQSFLYVRPPAATQTDAAFAVEGVGTFFAGRLRADRDVPSLAELSGVLVVLEDGRTVTAPRGVWDANARTWTLEGAQVTVAGASEAMLRTDPMPLPFPLESTPEQTLARPSQLTLTQLVARVRDLQAAGGNVAEARFALHRRLADASSAAVFALAAGALALRVRGRGAGLGWTIALIVAFWASWTLTGTLFEQGVLGPWAAAWATPAAVTAAGVGLGWWVSAR
jgi:lipopolysaccharide export system permease protein